MKKSVVILILAMSITFPPAGTLAQGSVLIFEAPSSLNQFNWAYVSDDAVFIYPLVDWYHLGEDVSLDSTWLIEELVWQGLYWPSESLTDDFSFAIYQSDGIYDGNPTFSTDPLFGPFKLSGVTRVGTGRSIDFNMVWCEVHEYTAPLDPLILEPGVYLFAIWNNTAGDAGEDNIDWFWLMGYDLAYGMVSHTPVWNPMGAAFKLQIFGSPAEPLKPDIEVSPMFHDFGGVAWRESGHTAAFTVSNVGPKELHLEGAQILQAPSDFQVEPASSLVLPPGGNLELQVRFLPTYLGYQEGTLAIMSDDPDEPELFLALSGEGVLAATTPERFQAVLSFIEDSLAGGLLWGTEDTGSPENRVQTLVNMIQTLEDLIEKEHLKQACWQADDLLLKVDGSDNPPDFVDGPSKAELNYILGVLRSEYCADEP